MEKTKLFKMVYGLGIALIVALVAALGTQAALAQEIPNGDNDLLWERSLRVDGKMRNFNDAIFHPINGNIIAAVDYEIWEIDPKDGHTIRVFEGGYQKNTEDAIKTINITSDGQKIITGGAMGQKGILIWDYNTGLVTKIISLNEIFDVYENIGIYPDNNRILFNTYKNEYGSQSNVLHINVYDLQKDSIIKRSNFYNTYCSRFRLSNNGQYVAYHFGRGTPGDFKDNMELWDAETLTKLQDMGKLSGEPDYIQFSINNEYLGFAFTPGFLLFKKSNGQFNRYLVYLPPILPSRFCFTNTNKLFLRIFKDDIQYGATYIINLSNLDSMYKFTAGIRLLRVNSNNELLTFGFDTLVGVKLQFYSNKWYEVGVSNPIEIKTGLTNTKYTNNSLSITTEGIEFINTLMITDTLGKKIYVQDEIPVINNQTTIQLFLPAGNYLLKVVSNGKVYTSKFIVSR